MGKLKKLLIIPAINAVCLFLLMGLVHAEERYIADTIVVSLREGPGPQYNVIKTLQTGQSFEVLERRNNFIRVRTKDGDEGWLQDQFTSTRPPSKNKGSDEARPPLTTPQNAPPLATAVDSQPGKEYADQAMDNESPEVKKLQIELAEMTERFKQLENDSQDVLQIKTENGQLKKELATIQESLAQVQQANATLASRENIYWFLSGGGVFLLGMMLGRISFRRQRHHSSLTL